MRIDCKDNGKLVFEQEIVGKIAATALVPNVLSPDDLRMISVVSPYLLRTNSGSAPDKLRPYRYGDDMAQVGFRYGK